MSESYGDGVRGLVARARREQIVVAATKVFARKGFGRATTKEIALEAGVSEGTIYNYFDDKDSLLMSILDRLNETERRSEAFEKGMGSSFGEFFEAYLKRRMSLVWEDRETFRVALAEMLVNADLRDDYLRSVLAPTMKIAEENFRVRIEAGEVKDTDATLAPRVVAGAVLGTIVLGLLGDDEIGSRTEETADVLAATLLHGLDPKNGESRED